MEYNTLQKKLILPEYGRNVHNMVQIAVNIKDRDQRNYAACLIIGVMASLTPQLRDTPDFKRKLWDHLHIMSDFKLDIDAPHPQPSHSELVERPQQVPYTQSHIRQKHYGKIIVEMLRETAKLQECEERDSLVLLLATQMKKSYVTWNRSEINNEQIAQDLCDISDGILKINPELIQNVEPVAVRESYHRSPHDFPKRKKRPRR